MKNITLFAVISFFLLSCNHTKETKKAHYEDQIGDTPFNPNLDNTNFKFCDSTNVLHKRALITYDGGTKALEKELLDSYKYNPNLKHFSGYFIVRFAVNCKNKTGRFRIQVLNSLFEEVDSATELTEHILDIAKKLDKWNHPYYKGKDYDGYSFITIKVINGKIQKT